METSSSMPSEWQRALLIMAHPDDPEYGAGAAVAQWIADGKEVSYVLATRGEAGIAGLDPVEAAAVREAEQRRACERVGVETVEFLDFADGRLEHSLVLRRELASAIRRHRPELVVTLNFDQTWGPGIWNSADHRHLGAAVMDAVADAANEWIFPDLYGGPEPHAGVEWVAVCSPRPTHWLDVDADSVERAVDSLAEHRMYLEALSEEPVEVQARRQIDLVTGGADAAARRVGFQLYSF